MANWVHNTLDITGPDSEIRKLAYTLAGENPMCIDFIDLMEHKRISLGFGAFPTDASLSMTATFESRVESPLREIASLSGRFPALKFELKAFMIPGEIGSDLHLFFQDGQIQEWLCPGDHESESCAKPEGFGMRYIYGFKWLYCDKHRRRWCVGELCRDDLETWPDELYALEDDVVLGEEAFILLGGENSIDEYELYSSESYEDISDLDLKFWRRTVARRHQYLSGTV